MGNIFDLIFENFWVAIILFGIVSSLFGGDKKQQNKKPYSETTLVPAITPAKPEHKPMPQQQRYAKKVQETTAEVPYEQQVKEELSTARAYNAEKAAMKNKEREQLPRKSHNYNRPLVDEKVTQGTFSQNEIVNGIIMSEILGAPRAKKPYSRARR